MSANRSGDDVMPVGFKAEADFEEIIRVYIEDELGARIGAAGS